MAHDTGADASHDPDVAVTFAATLIDQWRALGVRHVIVSPGSRSTPLVIGLQSALDRQATGGSGDVLQAHLVLDERSAAFQAVGVARATGHPAVLICTSGTAAVEYHPAVVEAHLAALPLLICTADRPPELQGSGAPQTIDQRELYGTSVRAYLEPGPPEAAGSAGWRALADEAFDLATGDRPGPVHLNLAFREPLVGEVGELSPVELSRPIGTAVPPDPELEAVEELIARCSGRRVLIVAGERAVPRPLSSSDGVLPHRSGGQVPTDPGGASTSGERTGGLERTVGETAVAILDAAQALGWPVLADPLSGLRLDHPAVVGNFDPMLRSEVVAEALRPDVVIRLGALVSSKVTNQWLAAVSDQVAIDPAGWFPDPDRSVSLPIRAASATVIGALTAAQDAGRLDVGVPGWADIWRRVSNSVNETLSGEIGGVVESAALAAALGGVPDGGHLLVSSSMPVRDLEWFGPAVPAGVTVHSNRGANGIDGVIATAVGVAHTGAPTVAVVGDLAMLHDVGSLASAAALDNLAIVVIDNGGGGIFSFLPQQQMLSVADFERWWGTPSGLDLAAIAAGFGLEVAEVEPSELAAAIRRTLSGAASGRAASTADDRVPRRPAPLFRVVSERAANVAQHQQLLDRLADEAEAVIDAIR